MTSRAARGASGLRDGLAAASGIPRDQREHAPIRSQGNLAERELVALWLLGRAPDGLLPWPLERPGRAGRGPGPDVREAVFLLPSGVRRTGDVEVHLRASDFEAHGHHRDPAYRNVILHLVWEDDAPARRAPPAPTVEVGPALGWSAERLRALVRRGPSGREPCAEAAAQRGADAVVETVRREGRRRLAERSWRAAELAAEHGWDEAWRLLLLRALRSSAGRRPQGEPELAATARALSARLGEEPLRTLAALAGAGELSAIVDALRGGGVGSARAAELGWNAALPLLIAAAAAYGDVALARRTASLADRWPAPRPYGRTQALRALLASGATNPRSAPSSGATNPRSAPSSGATNPRGAPSSGALSPRTAPSSGALSSRTAPSSGAPSPRTAPSSGALYAQGLLHLQDLWCTRGGCGVCPLSPGVREDDEP